MPAKRKYLKTAVAVNRIQDELSYKHNQLMITGINGEKVIEVNPIHNPPLNNQPLIFDVKPTPNEYIDLSRSLVQLSIKITQANGNNLPADVPVAPINLISHTMFNSIRTQINGVDVSDADSLYSFKAYFAHLLTHTKKRNKSVSAVFEGWVKDAPLDHCGSTNNAQNTGMEARRVLFAQSKVVHLQMYPYDGIWRQATLLPPNFSIRLTMNRASDQFILMEHVADGNASQNYKMEITKASLKLKCANVAEDLIGNHRALLHGSGLDFQLKAGQMKLFTIPQNSTVHIINGLCEGLLPNFIVFGIVNGVASTGTPTSNPLYFNHCNLNLVSLKKNNELMNGQRLEPTFTGNDADFVYQYHQQMVANNCFDSEEFWDISMDEWAKCSNIWAYEIKPYASQIDLVPDIGKLDLELHFAQPTTTNLSLVLSSQTQQKVKLTSDGSVQYVRQPS